MQQIIDTLHASGQAVVPVFRGIYDFTTGLIPTTGNGNVTVKPIEKVVEKQIVYKQPDWSSNRNLIRIAGLSGALAVALGAYGSHVIEMNKNIDEEQKRSFRSANQYHFIGTFGLIASALARKPNVSGALMAIGTLIFCGSCYTYAITGDASYKRYAPYGGSTLIIAWLSLLL